MWLEPQVQDGKSFMRRPYENGNAYRPAEIGNREQSLNPVDITHPNAQPAVMLKYLGRAVDLDGLLDPDPHAMLVDVEEQQLFQRGTLVHRQF